MRNNAYQLLRGQFVQELYNTGTIWRILRLTSLIDLLVVTYFYYDEDRNKDQLIEMFNIGMKAKICLRLGEVEIGNSLKIQLENVLEDEENIIGLYDDIFHSLQDQMNRYEGDLDTRLYKQIEYLKVISKLEINAIPEEIIDEILCLIQKHLQQQYEG